MLKSLRDNDVVPAEESIGFHGHKVLGYLKVFYFKYCVIYFLLSSKVYYALDSELDPTVSCNVRLDIGG